MMERASAFRAMKLLIVGMVGLSMTATLSYIIDVHPPSLPSPYLTNLEFAPTHPGRSEASSGELQNEDDHFHLDKNDFELVAVAKVHPQKTHGQKVTDRLIGKQHLDSSPLPPPGLLQSDQEEIQVISGAKYHEEVSEDPPPKSTPKTPLDLAPKQLTPGTSQCREYERGNAGVPRKTWVFENKKRNVDYSHMAMISRLPPNSTYTWLMVWQAARVIEGAEDQKLWASYSVDARTWTEGQPLDIPAKAILWSPVLHYDEGSDVRLKEGVDSVVGDAGHAVSLKKRKPRTILFFTESTVCLRPPDKNALNIPRYSPGGNIMMVFTYDGATWTEPRKLYLQSADGKIPKVIANQLLVHPQTGYWVLPFWHERPKQEVCKTSASVLTTAGVLVSKDRGLSWAPYGHMRAPGTWLIEGSVAALANGNIMQLFRTTTGLLYVSLSKDSGMTWDRPRKTTLPNPDSKVNVARLHSAGNDLALAFNDMNQWERANTRLVRFNRGRGRLKVAISTSNGRNWTRVALLEEGDDKLYHHYPTLIQDGCRLLVVYSVMQARPVVQRLHGVGGIRIAELGLHKYTDCTCKAEQ